MPGYTHLQRAQPISFAHHIMTYFWMLERDYTRFADSLKRIDISPLGAAALSGTTHPIDRHKTQELLGFEYIYENSLDAVSDRDYIIETLHNISLTMTHLSRFAEEIIFGLRMKRNLLHYLMHFLLVHLLCLKRKIQIWLNSFVVKWDVRQDI